MNKFIMKWSRNDTILVVKAMDKLFQEAIPILRKLHTNGYEAYYVGGSVRDYILGQAIHDVDIATSATPTAVQTLFQSVIPIGIEHGTVIVRMNGYSFEVTTFRQEDDYEDYRRPNTVTFISDLNEDLRRRDFTINAMAMTIDGKIIDPFHGQNDLHRRVIRTVGSPYDRFEEDPLRIMRALRFMSQLHFNLEEKTLIAMEKMNSFISFLAVERIAQEFEKLLLGRANSLALHQLVQLKLHHYLPGLAQKGSELKQFALQTHHCLELPREVWTLLLYYLRLEPESFLRKWRCSKRLIQQVSSLLKALKEPEGESDDFLYYELGYDLSLSYVTLKALIGTENRERMVARFEKQYENLSIKNRRDLRVNGNDFVKAFQKRPGPWLGDLIQAVEKAVLSGSLENDKEQMKEWGRRWLTQLKKD